MKNMKNIKMMIMLLVALVITSCEKVIDGEIPYQKQLVINCILTEGEPVIDVLITKTLPITYDWGWSDDIPSEAVISNAEAYIIEGENQYELSYINDSRYKVNNFIPEEGKTYQLVVKAEGLTATATTYIPTNPVFDTVYVDKIVRVDYDYGGFDTFAIINVDYLTKAYASNIFYLYQEKSSSYPISTSICKNFLKDKAVTHSLSYSVSKWNITNLPDIQINIFSLDNDYFTFYNNIDKGEEPYGIFSSSGLNQFSNIEGDGIGYFFGMNVLIIEKTDLKQQIIDKFNEMEE